MLTAVFPHTDHCFPLPDHSPPPPCLLPSLTLTAAIPPPRLLPCPGPVRGALGPRALCPACHCEHHSCLRRLIGLQPPRRVLFPYLLQCQQAARQRPAESSPCPAGRHTPWAHGLPVFQVLSTPRVEPLESKEEGCSQGQEGTEVPDESHHQCRVLWAEGAGRSRAGRGKLQAWG